MSRLAHTLLLTAPVSVVACQAAKVRQAREPGPPLRHVVEELRSADHEVRKAAVIELARFAEPGRDRESPGPPGADHPGASPGGGVSLTAEARRQAVVLIVSALKDESAGVRAAAAEALCRARSEEAVPYLAEALQDRDALVRTHASRALAELGAKAATALPQLLSAHGDRNWEVRSNTIEAMIRIAPTDERVIAAIVDRLDDAERKVRDRAAEALAGVGEPAIPLLVKHVRLGTPSSRGAAIDALRRMGTRAAPALSMLIDDLAGSDYTVSRNAVEAIRAIDPEPRAVLPRLLGMVGTPPRSQGASKMDPDAYELLEHCIRRHAIPREYLLALLERCQGGFARAWIISRLVERGVDDDLAGLLSELDLSSQPRLSTSVFLHLKDHPRLALSFLQRHPDALSEVSLFKYPKLLEIIRSPVPTYVELKKAVEWHDNLPSPIMARLGRPEYLPRIRERMKSADPHRLALLKACARAVGAPPDKVVKISETQPGDFKPRSLHPGVDSRRQDPNSHGHADGYSEVIVTGRLLMPDGSPADNPRFYHANDRMLLGLRRHEFAPIRYDTKTGRFVFFTTVFAAYSRGEGQPQPGPYQTGTALTRIKADGARTLLVRFYDEMPDVEIILSRAE